MKLISIKLLTKTRREEKLQKQKLDNHNKNLFVIDKKEKDDDANM